MKTLLVIALCFGSFAAFAQVEDMGMQGKTFEEKKATVTQIIEKRISHFNEMKTCVAAAKDESGLQKCRQEMKAHRKEISEKWPREKMKGKKK